MNHYCCLLSLVFIFSLLLNIGQSTFISSLHKRIDKFEEERDHWKEVVESWKNISIKCEENAKLWKKSSNSFEKTCNEWKNIAEDYQKLYERTNSILFNK